ncbi:NCS1 nucleoside transporter [Naematelia encephala]|uniref:NCS1 nucleoside transporter n=1 Tax=Naematelia encephala TaxID=71784 RepID=A0A1Y2AUD7_9TREE|nr:NCS1 nucleoside transporter [Naematelia encephala]
MSFGALKERLVLRDAAGNAASAWINDDIRPLSPEKRLWTWKTYGLYEFGINVLFVAWTTASSLLALGLTVGQAFACVIVGQFLTGVIGTLAVNIGAEAHVGFPVLNRLSWGMRGNWFPILNRVVLGTTWFAIESWYGGKCIKVAIGAIWPSFYHMHNPFRASLGMDGGDFLCWVIFLLFCLPLIYLRIEKMLIPASIVSGCVLVTCLGLLGWFVNQAGGGGILLSQPTHFSGVPLLQGSALAWQIVLGITTQISSTAQGILGFADWGRYAKGPHHSRLPFFMGSFVGTTFVATIGLICSSCAATIWPDVEELLWNPALILYNIQLHGSSAARAGVFFGAIAFVLSQYMLTVTACNLIGGLDLSGVLPKYINIRRGAMIVFVVGCVMQPWSLLSGANKFLTVMSSYGIFLAPLTGIMHADYYCLRKRKIALSDMYTPNEASAFWYWHGVNWRAIVAFCLGQAFLYPGFVARVQGTTVSLDPGWLHLYYLSYPFGYIVSGFLYWAASLIFPPPRVGAVDEYDIYGTFGPAEIDATGRTYDQQIGDSSKLVAPNRLAHSMEDAKDEEDAKMGPQSVVVVNEL